MRTPTSLLDLPDELLGRIVSETAFLNGGVPLPTLARVCSRLRPVVEEELYRSVVLDVARRQLVTFVRTLSRRSDLPDNIHNLDIRVLGMWTTPELRTQNAPRPRELGLAAQTLLDRRLSCLRKLRLGPVEINLLDDILGYLPDSAPSLEVLHVSPHGGRSASSGSGRSMSRRSFSSWRASSADKSITPTDWCAAVAGLERLKDLAFEAWSPAYVFPDAATARKSLHNLTALTVRGGMLEPVMDVPLAEILPNVLHLDVRHAGFAASHYTLGTAPCALVSLAVSPQTRDAAGVPLEDHIARFPFLKKLSVFKGSSAYALQPLLTNTAIESLTFAEHSEATDTLLCAIVDGPQRMPHLRQLVLQHVTRLEVDFSRLEHSQPGDVVETVRSIRESSGDALRFPPSCSRGGLDRAVELARGKDVQVDGTALKSLKWDAEFDRQLELYLCGHADVAAFRALARAYYGDGQARAIFSRVCPRLANPFAVATSEVETAAAPSA